MPRGRLKSGLSLLTDQEIVERCRAHYEAHGIAALSFQGLKEHKLYYPLYQRGIAQEQLLERLGLTEVYEAHKLTLPINRASGVSERWTWERIVREAGAVHAREGRLPPAGWFQSNGHASLVQAVYNLGKNWADVREAVGDFTGSAFVESRNGIRWRSHPEASLSNFLYARGVEHRRGERYPDEFALVAAQSRGFYDLHFLAADGRWIDVEVWGEDPGGHGRALYEAKRLDKEAFNASNPNFLGIEFRDCYDEKRLGDVLEPYIGRVEPFRFDRPTDALIQSTHWSNSDELLAFCRALAAEMPDGLFPTEEWLRKRGRWADRPGPAYNTASVYIKLWLGGLRRVRELLGQAHASTTAWDREKALEAWKAFIDRHDMTPSQYRNRAQRGIIPLDQAVFRDAARLDAAVRKFVGGTEEANNSIGYQTVAARKWTREAVYAAYRWAIERWNATPSQILYDHRTGKNRLSDAEQQHLKQLVDVSNREFGGTRTILREVGFKTPSRPRRKRSSQVVDSRAEPEAVD